MAQAPKPEDAVETTGVVPNLVTRVDLPGGKDTVLVSIIAAIERELNNGRQFYALRPRSNRLDIPRYRTQQLS